MEQCKKSSDRESVSDQLLKFDTLLDSVLIEQFHLTLPSTMRLMNEVKPHSGTDSSPGSLKEPDKKKQKKIEDAKERKVDNKKLINERLCNNDEIYQQNFAGKHLDRRSSLCPLSRIRFLFQWLCKNNTDTSSQDLPVSTKKEYIDFIKVCQSWSTGHTHLCEVPLNRIKVPPDLPPKPHNSSETRTSKSFLNGNDPLELFSLSKIPNYTLQPSVPPILSPSKEVLAMSDSTNLAKDLLGKFDIEICFTRT